MRGYDRWKTTAPEPPYDPGGEHFLGCRVVKGQNRHGLGRWGTLESYTIEVDEDESGKHAMVVFTVEFTDDEHPIEETMTIYEVEQQLGRR